MSNTPQIRFAGFTDAWEQRKLGECAEFNPKSELPDTFEYVDLESVVGTDILSHRTESKSSAPSRAQRLAQKGDVFYQTVRPYQKNNCIFEKDDNNWIFSTGYAQLRPVNDGYFLLTLLQNDDFVKLVLDRCTGTSYPAINSNDLADIDVSIPIDSKEQHQIGAYFKNLDTLITLHQRKCDALQKFKKSMLQKMFPQNGESVPEIRFAGFTDAWEQRELGEHLIKNNERNKELTISNVESVSNKKGFVKQTEQFEDYSVASSDLSNYYIIRENMFAYNPSRINVGSIAYKEKGDDIAVVSPLYVSFATKNIDDKYLWYWFKTSSFEQQRQVSSEGGVRDTLSFDKVNSMQIALPSVAEQQQIGSYFRNLDTLITLHQRKLETLQKMKKSLLQKMFV